MEKKPKKGIAKLAYNFKEKFDEYMYYKFFTPGGFELFIFLIIDFILIVVLAVILVVRLL